MNIENARLIEAVLENNDALFAMLKSNGNKQKTHAMLFALVVEAQAFDAKSRAFRNFCYNNPAWFNTSQFNQELQKFMDEGNAVGFPCAAQIIWRSADKQKSTLAALL